MISPYQTTYDSEIKCQDYPRYYVFYEDNKNSQHFGINVCKVYNENDNFRQWLVVSNRMKRLIARNLVNYNINIWHYGFQIDKYRWRISQEHNELFKKLEKIQAQSFEQLVSEREFKEAVDALSFSQKKLNNAKAEIKRCEFDDEYEKFVAECDLKHLLEEYEEAKKVLELRRQKNVELNNIKCLKNEEDYNWNEFMI